MKEKELEEKMHAFLRGDADVLVSTTIIESGLDIPQANTLIVERADMLGLSQLYQIRGRVGRSDATAYAFLFYPEARELTPEARARLATLADHTELGAGFAIAMRDLEIRGAGELLGGEQSGHVAAVGFELYVELLNEAVAELQGQRRVAARPVRVDARIDAYVPQQYVGSEALRIDIHRRLALSETEDELRELQASLEDRFGPLPEPVGEPLRDPGGEDQGRRPRRRLPRLPRREGDRRAARPRLPGAEGAAEPHPHGRLHDRERAKSPPERGRIPAGDPAGRCYLGSPPGSVRRRPSPLYRPSPRHPSPGIPMRLLRFVPLFALLAVVAVAAGCGGCSTKSVPSDAVAVVGSDNITKAQFTLLMTGTKSAYVARKTAFPKPGTTQYKALQDQTMKYLVQQSELAQKAKTLGIVVTDKDVAGAHHTDQEAVLRDNEKKYQQQLKAQGLTEPAARAEPARADPLREDLREGDRRREGHGRRHHEVLQRRTSRRTRRLRAATCATSS